MTLNTRRKRLRSFLLSALPERWRPQSRLVAVVRLQGAIGRAGPFAQGLSLASVEQTLEKAFCDDQALAVALEINSPGGSAVQSHLIFQRIRALAEQYDKPVLAFVEDVAASGGYMIACAADEIYADPSSVVGSIGVVSGGFGFVEAIGRLGVERRVYTAGESKAMLDPFLPEKPEEIARLKAIQADIHSHFIALVRSRRGDRLRESDQPLFTGAFWAGGRAVELGLIDGIGDMRAVLRSRYGDKIKLQRVSGKSGWGLRRLLGRQAAALPEAVAATISERSQWARYGL